MEIGYLEGYICNRNGCQGTMQRAEGVCCCHINPPCSYCENNEIICDECGEVFATGDEENWQNEINLKGNKMLKIIRININPEYTTQNGDLITNFNGNEYKIASLFKIEEIKYLAYKNEHTAHRELCDTLAEAKQYIHKLILDNAIERILRVAEIVE